MKIIVYIFIPEGEYLSIWIIAMVIHLIEYQYI